NDAARFGARLFEIEHRQISGADAAADARHAVILRELLRDDAGALEGGYDREPGRDQARHMHRGLGDADDRSRRDLSCREQARIAEAGDDVAIAPLRLALAHLVE